MTVHQVRWNYTINGQTVNNVQYWDIDSPTAQGRQDFADEIRSTWDAQLSAHVHQTVSLDSLSLREMNGGPAVVYLQPFTAGAVTGQASGDLVDLTSPLQVYYRSQTAKPNKGWMKFSGLTEAAWTGTGWSGIVKLAFTSLYNQYASGIPTASGNAILGICRPDFVGNTAIAFNLITSVIVRDYSRKAISRRPG